MKKIFVSQRNMLCIVALVAILVRIAAMLEWYDSPLSVLHLVSGLDMETHVNLGMLLRDGFGIATPYRVLIALLQQVDLVIIAQQLSGVAVALITTWITLHIYGNRWFALADGLFTALYAPAVMYELLTLQESITLFLSLGAFCATILARQKGFTLKYNLLLGVALGLASCGRPAGLPMVALLGAWALFYQFRRKRNYIKTGLSIGAGVAIIWIPVAIANYILSAWPLPFYGSNHAYIIAVASSDSISNWSAIEPKTTTSSVNLFAIFASFLTKFPMIFSINEIPDNVNLYFFVEHVKILKNLISPALLFPAFICGLIFMGRQLFRREGLILLYIIPLAVVIALYFPVGRYRLILYPALMIVGCFPFFSWGRSRTRKVVAVLAFVVIAVLMNISCPPPTRRASDYTTWALALQKMEKPSEAPQKYLEQAFRIEPRNHANLVRLMNDLLVKGEMRKAQELLAIYPKQDSYFYYFSGLIALGRGDATNAINYFGKSDPQKLEGLTTNGYFYHAESLRLLGKNEQALQFYTLAEKSAKTENQKRLIATMKTKIKK